MTDLRELGDRNRDRRPRRRGCHARGRGVAGPHRDRSSRLTSSWWPRSSTRSSGRSLTRTRGIRISPATTSFQVKSVRGWQRPPWRAFAGQYVVRDRGAGLPGRRAAGHAARSAAPAVISLEPGPGYHSPASSRSGPRPLSRSTAPRRRRPAVTARRSSAEASSRQTERPCRGDRRGRGIGGAFHRRPHGPVAAPPRRRSSDGQGHSPVRPSAPRRRRRYLARCSGQPHPRHGRRARRLRRPRLPDKPVPNRPARSSHPGVRRRCRCTRPRGGLPVVRADTVKRRLVLLLRTRSTGDDRNGHRSRH